MLRNLILILFFISTTSVYAQDSVKTNSQNIRSTANNDSLIVILYDGFKNKTSSISLKKAENIKSVYVVKDSLLKETYIIEKNTSKYISGIIVFEFKSDEHFWDFVAIKNKE